MSSSSSAAAALPAIFEEEALLSGGSNSEFVLNADGSILIDHKGVSRESIVLPISYSLDSQPCLLIYMHNIHYSFIIYHLHIHFYSQEPVTVQRFLCTKPLRSEVSTRKGEYRNCSLLKKTCSLFYPRNLTTTHDILLLHRPRGNEIIVHGWRYSNKDTQ